MKTLTEFCNQGEAGAMEMLVAFENEIVIGEDGWAQIAPFGDFPGMAIISDGKGGFTRERAIQRMDKQAVTQMVNEFTARRRSGVWRFLKSRPIFLGHPDAPGGGAKYPDKQVKGVFVNVAMRENGFYGEPILTDEGEQLVANKTVRAFSGRWEADQYLGEEMINGAKCKVFRPTRFLSAGLTDRPNLPVEMFNEAEQTNQKKEANMKKEAVIALLMGLGISGITIANEASDEQVSEALKQIGEKAKMAATLATEKTTLANDKASLANEKALLETQLGTLKTEKGTLATELATAKTNFANERKARTGELLDAAIKDGRITQAERATWEPRLANEATFANEASALSALTGKVKVASVTLQRGDRKVEISNAAERREMVADLVNEEMSAGKCGYDAAYSKVQKKYPALFEAMSAPAIKKGGVKS